jgi:hypothetical protein
MDLSKIEPPENALKYSHEAIRRKVEEASPHVRLIGIRFERAWKDNLATSSMLAFFPLCSTTHRNRRFI